MCIKVKYFLCKIELFQEFDGEKVMPKIIAVMQPLKDCYYQLDLESQPAITVRKSVFQAHSSQPWKNSWHRSRRFTELGLGN